MLTSMKMTPSWLLFLKMVLFRNMIWSKPRRQEKVLSIKFATLQMFAFPKLIELLIQTTYLVRDSLKRLKNKVLMSDLKKKSLWLVTTKVKKWWLDATTRKKTLTAKLKSILLTDLKFSQELLIFKVLWLVRIWIFMKCQREQETYASV